MDAYRELQENLMEFFQDVDDKMFVAFVECFVYHKGTSVAEVSKLIEKFLKENELSDAYVKYIYDITNSPTFLKSSMAERSLIEQINNALLSISFNRFRNYV